MTTRIAIRPILMQLCGVPNPDAPRSDPFVLSTPPHPSTTPQGQRSPGGAAGAAAAGLAS